MHQTADTGGETTSLDAGLFCRVRSTRSGSWLILKSHFDSYMQTPRSAHLSSVMCRSPAKRGLPRLSVHQTQRCDLDPYQGVAFISGLDSIRYFPDGMSRLEKLPCHRFELVSR